MLLELHAHTSLHSSCSHIDPLELIRRVRAKQLQGIIITEHHYLWTDDELAALRKEAEVEEGFLILAGQEVETDIGHVLVYGADETIPEQGEHIALEELRKRYPRAALVWAHPFRNGKKPTESRLASPFLDAIEIFNTNQNLVENFAGLTAWHAHKFNAVSGSDTHARETAAVYPTLFDHPVETIDNAVAELRAGRCRPFFKEIPKAGSNVTVTEITMGTKGETELRNRLIVRSIPDDKKWQKAKRSAELVAGLVARSFGSGPFRVPRVLEVREDERLIIEEGQRGRSLFELLGHVDPSVGGDYYKRAAQWLARLHNSGARESTVDELVERERKRFDAYLRAFTKTSSPFLADADMLISAVRGHEEALFARRAAGFVQSHGDFHPKNIIIGQDRMQDVSTLFVSVIDFDSAVLFSRAFDVGYFISQMESQFSAAPELRAIYTPEYFIDAYMKDAQDIGAEFIDDVRFFRVRAYISIAAYLVKVGKGTSPEIEAVFTAARRLLA